MSTLPPRDSLSAGALGSLRSWGSWLAVLAGVILLYWPSYRDAMDKLWGNEDQSQAPLVIAVSLYLAWRAFGDSAGLARQPRPRSGLLLIVAGLCLHLLGRVGGVLFLQLLSQWLVLPGLLLTFFGSALLRRLAFPLFFLGFSFPVPAFLLDAATEPLKQWVSWAAETLLYAAGFPVAREGVILAIGPYQLLVADACSGLRSIMALLALAVLFSYMSRRGGVLYRLVVVAGIFPLALAGNLARVIILMLVTYYFGDEAGQGFIHGAAGLVVFLLALGGLLAWENLLRVLLPRLAAER